MKTLYTAIGRFAWRSNGSSKEYPAVIISGQEYGLEPQELLLWNVLTWRILRQDNIRKHYNRAVMVSGCCPQRSYESCLDRLITRGLVISGSGETDYDALYDMIASLSIFPASGGLLVKILAIGKLTCKYGFSWRTAKFVFRKDNRTDTEHQVMALVNEAQLSTAEIIKCVDRDIRQLPNEEVVIDMLYHDDNTTSENICDLVKSAKRSKDVILAVSNLYLRQQVIFERI